MAEQEGIRRDLYQEGVVVCGKAQAWSGLMSEDQAEDRTAKADDDDDDEGRCEGLTMGKSSRVEGAKACQAGSVSGSPTYFER
jgi:hypothetical protein